VATNDPGCGEGPSITIPEFYWYGDFLITPMPGLTVIPLGQDVAFGFTLTLHDGQADIANQTFTGTNDSGDSGNVVTEQTTIEITHTPPTPLRFHLGSG
jgi:hypothetical protein